MGRASLKYAAGAAAIGAAAMLAVPVLAVSKPAPRAGDPTVGRAQTLRAAPRGQVPSVTAPSLTICSFDSTRSRAPFATATGTLGYGQMRTDLLDPSKFGSSGTVHRTIVIAAGIPTITTAALTGCDVFFTSVFTGDLSASEAAALKPAVNHGMKVITDADSNPDEMSSVNSVLTALNDPAGVGPGTTCPSDPNGGAVRFVGAGDGAAYGPFGDLRGNTWGTSPSAALTGYTAMVKCGGIAVRAVKGAVLVGGDPSGFDLFTTPSGGEFNPTNEAAYLNFIGAAH